MIKQYRNILVLAIVAVLCTGLLGCNVGAPVEAAPQAEEMGAPIVFMHDYAAGMELARQERKPALVFFSIPDNVGSQRMLETTFRDDEIRRLAEWLICIHVDGSRDADLCEALGITSFPTVILSNANGVEVRRLVGRQTSDQLAVQIHILLQVVALRPQAVNGW